MSKKKKNKLTPKERYAYLINARNFPYDNFNKWTTYFYVAIGVLFVGYYSLEKCDDFNINELAILTLGYITSLLWYWSNKGYYYWNINFIQLINNCETDSLKLKPKERVYFVFANKKTENNYWNPISGANVSTSKVALLFSFMVTIVWNILFFIKLNTYNNCPYNNWAVALSTIPITLIISYIIPQNFLKSNITKTPDLKI